MSPHRCFTTEKFIANFRSIGNTPMHVSFNLLSYPFISLCLHVCIAYDPHLISRPAWAETWRQVWRDGPNFRMTFLVISRTKFSNDLFKQNISMKISEDLFLVIDSIFSVFVCL